MEGLLPKVEWLNKLIDKWFYNGTHYPTNNVCEIIKMFNLYWESIPPDIVFYNDNGQVNLKWNRLGINCKINILFKTIKYDNLDQIPVSSDEIKNLSLYISNKNSSLHSL